LEFFHCQNAGANEGANVYQQDQDSLPAVVHLDHVPPGHDREQNNRRLLGLHQDFVERRDAQLGCDDSKDEYLEDYGDGWHKK
jgi:hypothetical protein